MYRFGYILVKILNQQFTAFCIDLDTKVCKKSSFRGKKLPGRMQTFAGCRLFWVTCHNFMASCHKKCRLSTKSAPYRSALSVSFTTEKRDDESSNRKRHFGWFRPFTGVTPVGYLSSRAPNKIVAAPSPPALIESSRCQNPQAPLLQPLTSAAVVP